MGNEMPLGLRFSLLHRSFKKKIDELLREKDLTGVQFFVLGALMRLERAGTGEIHQRDLERETHVTHPTMTELLKRLEKKELIRCVLSERDRRSKCISSTEKCRRLAQEVREADEATTRWLCRGLSEEQMDQLIAVTDKMLQNAFENDGKGCGCL
jgi:DNA-binding MarR family transcriptional regulator